MTQPPKRFYRSRTERQIAGICGGLGEYAGIDPILVRVIVIAATCVTGFLPGLVAYIAAWFVVPETPLPGPTRGPA